MFGYNGFKAYRIFLQVPPPSAPCAEKTKMVFSAGAGSMRSVCVNICSGDELLFLAPLRLYLCHKTPLQITLQQCTSLRNFLPPLKLTQKDSLNV